MEWQVLDWNTPAMAFCDQLGAAPLKQWQPYRMVGEEIRKLAEDGLRRRFAQLTTIRALARI